MKQLTLIRHAKSSWDDPDADDFGRTLNKRGRHDATRIGKWLDDKKVSPDILWCSTATRARATLKGLRKEWTVDDLRIRYRRDLNSMNAIKLINKIAKLHAGVNEIAIIGHNPCLEKLYNLLAMEPCEKFATGAVARLKLNIQSWEDIHSIAQDAKILAFIKPKMLK